MKFNITSYTLFSFVIVLFFPSLIFAPWTKDKRPQPAPKGTRKTCPEWISFNGFTLDKYKENVKLAKLRDVMFDHEATTFAAMYAFHIGGLEAPSEILPEKFCFAFDNTPYSFTRLSEEYKTCPNWILLYGFLEFDSNPNAASTSNQVDSNPNAGSTSNQVTSIADSDINYNKNYASNQNEDTMKATSIFVYSYYLYLTRKGYQPLIKPSVFCENLGKAPNDNTIKPFVNTYGPPLTCKAWIELYGFGDKIDYNAGKIFDLELNTYSENYKLLHELPLMYARNLRDLVMNEDSWRQFTLSKFCKKFITMDASRTFTFNYKYSRPTWSSYA